MICRVAFHDSSPGPITDERPEGFRRWMAALPGFVAGWHAQDPESGRLVSFTVWESAAHLEALRDMTPPGGPAGMRPTQVHTFSVVRPFSS